jgi:hypothetical protein
LGEHAPARAGPSFGERAVRLVDPTGDAAARGCSATFALAIDQLHWLRELTDDPEVKRLASAAITKAQTAHMWAVKALTWKG